MKEDLDELFQRLTTEGASAMPDIYALTAPHVFGIITQIIPDKADSEKVLKKVYARVWARRDILVSRHKGDPLNYLRRLAHRSAMDFKFKMNIESKLESDDRNLPEMDIAKAEVLGVTEQDMRILKLAYLNGASVSDISAIENVDRTFIKASLSRTMDRLRGDGS